MNRMELNSGVIEDGDIGGRSEIVDQQNKKVLKRVQGDVSCSEDLVDKVDIKGVDCKVDDMDNLSGDIVPFSPLSRRPIQKGGSDHSLRNVVQEGFDTFNYGDSGEIVVTPSWTPGMTCKRYRYATHGFLSQYRLLGYGTEGNVRCKKNGVGSPVMIRRIATRYSNKSYGTDSDVDKTHRTRRAAKSLDALAVDASENLVQTSITKPFSRANRKSKKVRPYQGQQGYSTTQLSGKKDLQIVPNYVPNISWESLPDYSPPFSTLPANNNVKCLKVEWKGSSMDLSADPLRYKLHSAELVLAQTLRLPCDLYLDSKRRLFCEKVHRLKQGMPFRRTDAQKACRIDVNKASRLFAAYEKIGWLNDDKFTKYL